MAVDKCTSSFIKSINKKFEIVLALSTSTKSNSVVVRGYLHWLVSLKIIQRFVIDERCWKNRIAARTRMWFVYTCVPFHTAEGHERSRSRLGNGHLGKPAIDTLDLSMMKKKVADLEAKGKKHGSTQGLISYSCQGKGAGVGCDTSS